MLQDIHKKIKAIREEYKISQQEMSEVFGVTRATYSQIEIGLREIKLSEFIKFIDWELNHKLRAKKDTMTKEQFYKYTSTMLKPPFIGKEFEDLWRTIKSL